jgi:hypothetical protein
MTATNINVDRVLAESFPASDPPPWVFGGSTPEIDTLPAIAPHDVVLLSNNQATPWRARAVRHLRSWAMACGVVLLLPIGIIALPIALVFRALLSAGSWRFAVWK